MDSRVALFACAVVLAAFAVDHTVGAPQKDAKAPSPLKEMKDSMAGAPQKDPKDPAYTTKYDNIDVDQVLASKRLVNSYVQCLLDKKPCTPEGAELRKILPDALKTHCVKCNEKQKNTAIRVVDRLDKDYPAEWKLLLDKWDPKREHLEGFQKYIQEQKKKGLVKL